MDERQVPANEGEVHVRRPDPGPPFRPPMRPPFHPPPGFMMRPPFQPPTPHFRPPPMWAPPPGHAFTRPPPPPASAPPQPRPPPAPVAVSSALVPGTEWLEVRTSDGRTFWHHTTSGEGVWKAPQEVVVAQRLDPRKKAMLDRAKAAGAQVAPEYLVLGRGAQRSGGPAEEAQQAEQADDDVTFTEDDIVGGSDDRQQPAQADASGGKGEAAAQGVVRDGQAGSQPPAPCVPHPDDVATDFDRLLAEKEVHAFSRWERELPKLRDDPRFQALPTSQRRPTFEAYCSRVGQSKKAAGKSAPSAAAAPSGKAADDAFKSLLREQGVNADSGWRHTLDRIASDPRCSSLPPDRAKTLFLGVVAAAQRVAQAHAVAERRAQAERRAGERRQRQAGQADAEANYGALLKEVVRDAGTTWEQSRPLLEADPLGRGTNPLLDEAASQEAFAAHVAWLVDAAQSDYLDLLEAHRGLPDASWEEAEAVLRDDARFHRLPQGMREGVWRQFVADKQWNATNVGELKRTQRRQPAAAAAAPSTGVRRDGAYDREYLEVDRKRLRRD